MSSKYQVVPFRMSPDEKKMLKDICKQEDLSMAQWIRRSIKEAYEKFKKTMV